MNGQDNTRRRGVIRKAVQQVAEVLEGRLLLSADLQEATVYVDHSAMQASAASASQKPTRVKGPIARTIGTGSIDLDNAGPGPSSPHIAYSDMNSGSGWNSFAADAYLGWEDYDTADNASLQLSQLRFVGGVTAVGQTINFDFYDMSSNWQSGFSVTFAQAGAFIWTINGLSNTVPDHGTLELTSPDGTGQWFLSNGTPTAGTNDPTVGYGSGANMTQKFELTGDTGTIVNNDNFVNRIDLGSGITGSGSGNNSGYSGESGEPAQSEAIHSAWWSWTATSDGTVSVDTFGSSLDTFLTVATGSAVDLLTVLAQNDDMGGLQSQVSIPAVAGTQYQFAVDGFDSDVGAITIHVSFTGVGVGNDHFADRTDLGSGSTATDAGNNSGYSGEAGEPAQSGAINSAWWSWTAPGNGTLSVDTFGSGLDTFLTVARGSAVDSLTVLAQNDDADGGFQSQVSGVPVVAGTQYQFAVDGYDSDVGAIVLNLSFAVTTPAEVRGSKWNDLDGNGVWDSGEPALAGWHIYLDENENGSYDAGEPDAITQADGSYVIPNVATGLHIVAEAPQTGWTQTSPASPLALSQRFNGIGYTGWRPPDSTAAVGPSNVLGMVNSTIGLYSKTGAALGSADLDIFFNSVDHNFGPFDPWATYDSYSGRYFAMAEEVDSATQQAFYLIAVSTNSTPDDLNPASAGGDWYFYNVSATHDFGGGLAWLDYPKLATDADSVYLTGNYFLFAGNAFQRAMITRLDKTPMLSGTAGTRTDIIAPSAAFTLQPAQSVGRLASAPQLFVDSFTHYPSGITVWELDDSNVLTEKANLGSSWSYFGSGVPQLSTSQRVDSLSPRLMNAVWRNNSLWTTHTVDVGGEATVRWYEVGTTGGVYSLVQQGDIDPGPEIQTFMPAIAVDGAGNMGITYSQGGISQYPSMMVSGRRAGDPAGTTLPGALVKTSSTYYDPSSDTTERWGDYSGIGVDPADDSTFWALNEYVVTNTAWGTYWGSFRFGAPQARPQWVVAASGASLTVNFGNRQSDVTAPTITGVTGPADGWYGNGQNLDFTVNFSENVTVTGTPRISLTIGSATRYANYVSGSGSSALVFRYAIAAGDYDTDGVSCVSPIDLNGGTVADVAANNASLAFTPPSTSGVRVDTMAPMVTGVYVRGSSWVSGYLSFLAANLPGSSASYGYAIPVGSGTAQLQTLPWRNLNRISIAFSEDVSVAQAQFAIVGSVGSYSVSGFAYSSADHVATWSLAAAIGPDKLYVAVPGSGASPTVDLAGNVLDGEWTNPTSYSQSGSTSVFPSGNGSAGGDFAFRFDVLPGDSTGGSLGKVNVADVAQTKTRSNLPISTSTYRSDFDGNNLVNVADVAYAKTRSSLYALPVNPPVLPVFGPVFSQVSLLQENRSPYLW